MLARLSPRNWIQILRESIHETQLVQVGRPIVYLRCVLLAAFLFVIWGIGTPYVMRPLGLVWLSPTVTMLLAVAYTGAVACWMWWRYPLNRDQFVWILAGDIVLALIILFGAGVTNLLVPYSLSVITIQAALILAWRPASIVILSDVLLRAAIGLYAWIFVQDLVTGTILITFSFSSMILGTIILLVVEQSRREYEARRAAAEEAARLRRFEESRTTFFDAVAHELKTPLTVLKTLAPMHQDLQHLPKEVVSEIEETITQNLARLESLINDMLEAAQLDAEAVQLRCAPVNLVGRVQSTAQSMRPLLAHKEQSIAISVEGEIPLVWGDGKRIDDILANLIDNARKFAPPASVIEIELARADRWVRVCVLDSGPGVASAERHKIFERFYTTAQNGMAGVGLGLFICRELVRLHGGRIWVEDRDQGGSCFCFTLPIATPEQLEGAMDAETDALWADTHSQRNNQIKNNQTK